MGFLSHHLDLLYVLSFSPLSPDFVTTSGSHKFKNEMQPSLAKVAAPPFFKNPTPPVPPREPNKRAACKVCKAANIA